MRRSILARVKFLSRLLTALNLLPSMATLACVSKPIERHSAIKRAHTLRMAVPLSLRKSAIAPSGRRALAADSAAIGRHGERGVGGAGCVLVVVIVCRALSDIGGTCS